MTRKLSILVPSRGRPESISRLWHAVIATAERPTEIEIRVRLDDDDPTRARYPLITATSTRFAPVAYTRGPRIRLAASWNEQAEQAAAAGATHLALWGDDNIPVTQGWDRMLLDRLEADGPGFVYGRDGVWDGTYDTKVPGHLVLPTAVVMPVEVYRALGWVSAPGLTHLCIDVAWRDLGVAAGCLFYEPGVFVRHFHRCAGAPDDQTYRDANDDGTQVRADNRALTAWKTSPDFKRCVSALKALRGVRA